MRDELPVYVHGMLKMESFSGVIRPDEGRGHGHVQRARRAAHRASRGSKSATRRRWPARWSMPCRTWSTIPTAAPSRRSTASCRPSSRRRCCSDMKLDLKDDPEKRTNLNAQEIGDDARSAPSSGSASDRNPVFDEAEVQNDGEGRRQAADRACSSPTAAGAGSAASASSRYPHTTAVVVHGLQIAQAQRRGAAARRARARRRLAARRTRTEQVAAAQERADEDASP